MPGLSFVVLAAAVTAVLLPEGYTIAPEGERRLMAVNARGTIVASLSVPNNSGMARAARWRPGRGVEIFRPLPTESGNPTAETVSDSTAALGPDDVAYVDVSHAFSGAYIGVWYDTERWTGTSAQRFKPPCGGGWYPHAEAVDRAGRVAMTFTTTEPGWSLMQGDRSGTSAPYAEVVQGSACTSLGRGVVHALNGRFAAGYRGYLGGVPVADEVDPFAQTVRAVRWSEGIAREIGPGVGLAVNAGGMVAGASAIPARAGALRMEHGPRGLVYRESEAGIPQARVWDAAGRASDIVRGAARSVAYDVGDDGTVIGMLQEPDGRHFAFRWRAGMLQRFDDLPHPAGWRFESAYALAPDGAIVGIGTYRGVATGFVYRP